jgi:hypothetical protein
MSIGCLFNSSTFSTCLINTDRFGWSAFIGLRKECLHDMSARQRAAALPPSVMRRDAPAPWQPSGTVPAAGVLSSTGESGRQARYGAGRVRSEFH